MINRKSSCLKLLVATVDLLKNESLRCLLAFPAFAFSLKQF